ncbi:hypothetical protein [Blastococcus sp. SYSU DS1024]
MGWVLILIAVWMMLGLAVAIVIGRGIRLADSAAEAARTRFTEPTAEAARPPRSTVCADEAPWSPRGGAATEGLPRRARPPGSPSIDERIRASDTAPIDREPGLA